MGLVLGTGLATAIATATTVRASVSSSGTEGSMGSYGGSISSDGNRVAFYSRSWSLVTSDTNAEYDVFVRDLLAGTTERVSVDSSGTQANSESTAPSISADGNFVVFFSGATNLVDGDTNDRGDVFVRDLLAGTTERVSVDSSGTEGDATSESPSISADGRYVAFVSRATNLVSDDTNAAYDIFVHDRTAGTTTRVSVTSAEEQGDGEAGSPSISADGKHVAFTSSSTNLAPGGTSGGDVFVRDLVAGTTTRVSVDSSEVAGNNQSMGASISSDGRYVAFYSWATNLVAGDTNAADDVFVRDVVAGVTTRVSAGPSGVSGDGGSYQPSISADGRSVAFYSSASNLIAGDTNLTYDVFVRDRATGTTTRVSVDSSGVAGNVGSTGPSISAGGRYVAFLSGATNLVAGDTNIAEDVFVHDRGPIPAVTAVALSTGSKNPLAYGASFVVAGTLKSGGVGLTGQQVILQSAAPGAAFKDSSLKDVTEAGGAFSFSVKPTSKTLYRVRFAGSAGYLFANPTAVVYATPKVYVRTPIAPSTMLHTRYYTVYGYLKPRHASSSHPVRVYKYRRVSGRWKSYGYVSAKASNYSGYTKYSVKLRLSRTGRWRLRAYAPSDSGHAATWSSGFDYVTVK